MKIKIRKYVAEGQGSVVAQISELYKDIDTAKSGNPAPLLAKLTGIKDIGNYIDHSTYEVSPDGVANEKLKPFLTQSNDILKTEAKNVRQNKPIRGGVNTSALNSAQQLSIGNQSSSPESKFKLNAPLVYKEAFKKLKELATSAVNNRVVDFGSLTAEQIVMTAHPEFILRASKYARGASAKLKELEADPSKISSINLDYYNGLSDEVSKAIEQAKELVNQNKTEEINALAMQIKAQYQDKDFTQLLQDFVKSHPGQSPCDGFTQVEGVEKPVTVLGFAVKAFSNGIKRPLEYLAKTFPNETLEDDGEGKWQAPIASAPDAEKQDEAQEFFHQMKQGGTMSANPEDQKVSDDELKSDRFGGDVNSFLKDLLAPYMMISFDGKVVNDSNDTIKQLQAPLGDEVKDPRALKLSTIQQYAKHAIDNGIIDIEVDEDALDITRMKRGMKEVCKKIIDMLGVQSKRNSNGLTPKEKRFLKVIAKNCALLPNGGIASLAKLRELRDLGKKKGVLSKWLTNPDNKNFKQRGIRSIFSALGTDVGEGIKNVATGIGNALGFGESQQDLADLSNRVNARLFEAKVKDPFGMRGLLVLDESNYSFLDEDN